MGEFRRGSIHAYIWRRPCRFQQRQKYRWIVFLLCLYCVSMIYMFWGNRDEYINPCSINSSSTKCVKEFSGKILTAHCPSRLGNQMFSYAILFAISIYNDRPAYMSPIMSNYISKYFNPSLDTLDEKLYTNTSWSVRKIGARVPSDIKNLSNIENIKFCCYPQSYRYFDEIRPIILREFAFKSAIRQRARHKLLEARRELFHDFEYSFSLSVTTFVAIHVRRTDYLSESKKLTFRMPTPRFYKSGMDYFKSKYPNVVFIVGSDDLAWCKKWFKKQTTFGYIQTLNFSKKKKEHTNYHIHYLNGTSEKDAGLDMAVLAECDHVIFGLGTFAFWAAYLSGGEVVYCADCITAKSVWMKDPLVYGGNYSNFVLPSWKGLSWNGARFLS